MSRFTAEYSRDHQLKEREMLARTSEWIGSGFLMSHPAVKDFVTNVGKSASRYDMRLTPLFESPMEYIVFKLTLSSRTANNLVYFDSLSNPSKEDKTASTGTCIFFKDLSQKDALMADYERMKVALLRGREATDPSFLNIPKLSSVFKIGDSEISLPDNILHVDTTECETPQTLEMVYDRLIQAYLETSSYIRKNDTSSDEARMCVHNLCTVLKELVLHLNEVSSRLIDANIMPISIDTDPTEFYRWAYFDQRRRQDGTVIEIDDYSRNRALQPKIQRVLNFRPESRTSNPPTLAEMVTASWNLLVNEVVNQPEQVKVFAAIYPELFFDESQLEEKYRGITALDGLKYAESISRSKNGWIRDVLPLSAIIKAIDPSIR